MRTLSVFNSITVDGYFTGKNGDMSFAHQRQDAEWNAYIAENAKGGGGEMLFGRVTYEMMVSFWPTPQAAKTMPVVAERMNSLPKVVFSRTLKEATWNNTTLVKTDPVAAVRQLKQLPGEDMVIMGSGTIIALLAGAGLIDLYQMVLTPVVLGSGRTMFEGLAKPLSLKHTTTRMFDNGNAVLGYVPA